MTAVLARYQKELAEKGYQSDTAQLAAVAALDRCASEWAHYKQKRSGKLKKLLNRPPLPLGVYLYGGVGRGKSFLMDSFYQAVPIKRKTRLHFHEFMREVQRELAQLQGTVDPLDALAKRIAQRYKLICFDEFHVSNVADAMILHRLLQALFDNGVGLVATSNFHPDGLYPDGLHRERILPAIEMLKTTMQILSVDNGVDYRQQALNQAHSLAYLYPLSASTKEAMQMAYRRFSSTQEQNASKDVHIALGSRSIKAVQRCGDVVWFEFKTLCENAHAQNDYLELAQAFETILLSNVPQMGASMASAARRFTLLVDVMYDRCVKMVISAAVAPQELYTQGLLAHEFVRTASRLQEMQSAEYWQKPRRLVDTGLV